MKQTIFSEAAYSPNKTEKPIKYNNCIPRREAGDFSMFVQSQRFFRLRADRTDYGALKHILLRNRHELVSKLIMLPNMIEILLKSFRKKNWERSHSISCSQRQGSPVRYVTQLRHAIALIEVPESLCSKAESRR